MGLFIRRAFLSVLMYLSVLIGSMVHPASATTVGVALDTSALVGTSAQLAFDLTSSDPAANTATISNFQTDGSLGTATPTNGPVTGVLPGTTTLEDSAFFNELLQAITLGHMISFTLTVTEQRTGSGSPDEFALFLLDAATPPLPLFSTDDPTGAQALFILDITGTASGDLQVFAPTSSPAATTQVTPVPEPASFVLCAVGLGALAAWRRWPHYLRTARGASR